MKFQILFLAAFSFANPIPLTADQIEAMVLQSIAQSTVGGLSLAQEITSGKKAGSVNGTAIAKTLDRTIEGIGNAIGNGLNNSDVSYLTGSVGHAAVAIDQIIQGAQKSGSAQAADIMQGSVGVAADITNFALALAAMIKNQ